jgi:hypothetical protein
MSQQPVNPRGECICICLFVMLCLKGSPVLAVMN